MSARVPAITADEYQDLVLAGLDAEIIKRLAQYRQAVHRGALNAPEER